MNWKNYLYGLIAFAFSVSCDQFNNPLVGLDEDFVRIYNVNTNFSFEALSMEELPDGGFLLLGTQLIQNSASEPGTWKPYLLEVDRYGDFVWDTVLGAYEYDNDLLDESLLEVRGKYYMSSVIETDVDDIYTYVILEFDRETKTVQQVYQHANQENFIALTAGPDNTLIMGYYTSCITSSDRGCLLRQVTTDGAEVWSYLYRTANGKPENPCINQANTQPLQLGYYTSETGQHYLYARMIDAIANTANGQYSFYRFNADNGEFIDRIPYMNVNRLAVLPNGVRDMSFLLMEGTEDSVRIVTNNFTANEADVLLPQIVLNLNTDTISVRANGFTSHEYSHESSLAPYRTTSNDGHTYIIYVGTTWSGQVLMTAFDDATHIVVNKRYLGYQMYYNANDFMITNDGGYAIYGYTITSGRFQQLFLLKFSNQQLQDFLNETI